MEELRNPPKDSLGGHHIELQFRVDHTIDLMMTAKCQISNIKTFV